MVKRQTLAILFFIRSDKRRKDGKVPIYLRITVNGKRAEMAIHRYVEEGKWNSSGGYVRGTKQNAREINAFIDIQRSRVYEAQRELLGLNKVVSAAALRNLVQGQSVGQKTVCEVFEYHNNNLKALSGSEYSPNTLKRYNTTLEHVKSFIKYKYKTDDIYLSELDHEFVTELEHYFKVVRNCNHNTTMKYIKNLKKVINIAINNDWLTKDPFSRFSVRLKHTDRAFLTMEELNRIESLEELTPSLDQVKDVFVFACYTSLAYTDVANLSVENIVVNLRGRKEIAYKREKTGTEGRIPMLPVVEIILRKYEQHPITNSSGRLLPVISNQKTNQYLKDIAKAAKIDKKITFHMARHTFATTIALANGMTMEGLSKALAHADIRSTQIYGKIMDEQVRDEMEIVEKKLIERYSKPKRIANSNGK